MHCFSASTEKYQNNKLLKNEVCYSLVDALNKEMLMNDIYQKLRNRLDALSVGFPETTSGIEMKILKRLFSEEDAALFLTLLPVPETAEKIAARIGSTIEETAEHLEDMAKRGLLFRRRKNDSTKYGIVPYMVGIFEFQLKHLDKELAQDLEEYFETGIGPRLHGQATSLLRTIPVDIDFASQLPVAPYEDAMKIIDSHEVIAVSDCVCRVTKNTIDDGCDYPLENCLQFGTSAEYFVENDMGRFISREEAKEIIKASDEAGLVLQPYNDQKVASICSCCGCCCIALRSIKMHSVPAQAVHTNYFVEVDSHTCTGCGICETRCHMDAIAVNDSGIARVDRDRCIGCGLCVSTCGPQSVFLVRKSEQEATDPPANGVETQMRILKERGLR